MLIGLITCVWGPVSHMARFSFERRGSGWDSDSGQRRGRSQRKCWKCGQESGECELINVQECAYSYVLRKMCVRWGVVCAQNEQMVRIILLIRMTILTLHFQFAWMMKKGSRWRKITLPLLPQARQFLLTQAGMMKKSIMCGTHWWSSSVTCTLAWVWRRKWVKSPQPELHSRAIFHSTFYVTRMTVVDFLRSDCRRSSPSLTHLRLHNLCLRRPYRLTNSLAHSLCCTGGKKSHLDYRSVSSDRAEKQCRPGTCGPLLLPLSGASASDRCASAASSHV